MSIHRWKRGICDAEYYTGCRGIQLVVKVGGRPAFSVWVLAPRRSGLGWSVVLPGHARCNWYPTQHEAKQWGVEEAIQCLRCAQQDLRECLLVVPPPQAKKKKEGRR